MAACPTHNLFTFLPNCGKMGKRPTFEGHNQIMAIQRTIPIVDQVTAELRKRIHDRTYPPGGRLPSESELAQELGVSRTTVRTVLAKFAVEGLILRKQGDGTYINERLDDVDTHYGGLWDFSRLIESNGFRPYIKTLSLEIRDATTEEAKKLEIEPTADVVSMVRLFSADNRPTIYTTNIFPKEIIKTSLDQIDGNMPIHEFLQSCCNEQITYVISNIEATQAKGNFKTQLQLKNGQPLLKLSEIFFNTNHHPLILGISYYDFTVIKLRLVRAWG